jgi:putative heme-binding domain-containing protein
MDALSLLANPLERGSHHVDALIADENPRVRLEAIAACSHVPKPESIAVALRALDKPTDSFIDRTLELAVYSLAPQWEPALREGKLTLPPKHLAWLLDKKSDGDTLARIRTTLHDKPDTFDAESKKALLLMLAKRGTEEDVGAALDAGVKDAELLSQLADLVETQQLKAPAQALEMLRNAPTNTSVARLIGLWKLAPLAQQLKAALYASTSLAETKRAALVSLARLGVESKLMQDFVADPQQPYLVRIGAIEALAIHQITPAAQGAVALMPAAKDEEDMRALLAPFMAKAGRAKPLVAAITETPCSKEAADLATRALIAMGRNEPELSAALNKILGRTSVVMPYDAQWVSGLANEATVAGNPKKGNEIFHRVTLNCTACHSIGGQGGIIGPQLDAVGRGMPVELIVEAVMWPQRQIKEGYVATTVIMKDGRTLVGYKSKETGTELTVRDLATKAETTLQKSQMQSHTEAGSLMPDGLTASLSREELRDLIAYLASLGKEK